MGKDTMSHNRRCSDTKITLGRRRSFSRRGSRDSLRYSAAFRISALSSIEIITELCCVGGEFMRAVVGGKLGKFDGQKNPVPEAEQETQQNQTEHTDRNVRNVVHISSARISFGDLARFAWPSKAEANLSHLTGYDGRTCRRWLAGDTEPPAEALGVVLAEIMKRFHQR